MSTNDLPNDSCSTFETNMSGQIEHHKAMQKLRIEAQCQWFEDRVIDRIIKATAFHWASETTAEFRRPGSVLRYRQGCSPVMP